MKKLLGFFSILGITSSLSSGPTMAFAENDFDWTTPATVVESISKIINTRVFATREDFVQFIDSSLYNKYTHIIHSDADSIKPNDILVTFDEVENGVYKFNAFLFRENDGKLAISKEDNASRIVSVNIKDFK
jgi:hypothetical protein